MGREVRRVPENWVHPTHWRYKKLVHTPLLPADLYIEACKEYETGEREEKPVLTDYMPFFIETETTHYQMYEDCSEGTPISPVCDSPESLAHWLADNGASSFGDETATYDEWMKMIEQGSAPTAVLVSGKLTSGVKARSAPKWRLESERN